MLVRELAVEDLQLAGFDVTGVGSGDEAFELITRDRHFDVLITDIRMPGSLDGWGLGTRAAELAPGIRVIYATGYSERVKTLAGHERFLSKPYRFEALVGLMRDMGMAV